LKVKEKLNGSACHIDRRQKIVALRPVIVCDMTFDERITHGGIVLLNDDMKSSGITTMGKVYAVRLANGHKTNNSLLISHGRWTRGIKIDDGSGEITIRKVDNKDILLVSNEPCKILQCQIRLFNMNFIKKWISSVPN